MLIGEKNKRNILLWVDQSRPPKTWGPQLFDFRRGSPSPRLSTSTLSVNGGRKGSNHPLSALTLQVESVRSLLDPKSRENATPDFEGATVVTFDEISSIF